MAPVSFLRPIAHRGLHDAQKGVIENSESAFAAAIAADYGIECDLQLSGDGVPMVFHDPDLHRLTGQTGLVRTLSAGQLGRVVLTGSATGDRPQRLTELLEQVGGRSQLVLELKPQSGDGNQIMAEAVMRALLTYEGPVAIESFDPRPIAALQRLGYQGPVGMVLARFTEAETEDYGLSGWDRFFLRHALHYPRTRFDFVSVDKDALKLPAVRLMRWLGRPVTSWTIRSIKEARAVSGLANQIVFEGFRPA